MKNIIFEHVKDDTCAAFIYFEKLPKAITLMRGKKSNYGYKYRFFFSIVAISSFDACKQFRCYNIAIVNKNGLFLFFFDTSINFGCVKIRDKAPLRWLVMVSIFFSNARLWCWIAAIT